MTIRRLAAILAADMVAFSFMMEKDEEGTLAQIKSPAPAVDDCAVWQPVRSALQPPRRSAFLPFSAARTIQKIAVSESARQRPWGGGLDNVGVVGLLTMSVPTAPRSTD
jgi:hypothetical protein